MRVAFITQCRPCRELGGGRAQAEIAEGWPGDPRPVVLGPEDLVRAAGGGTSPQAAFERWSREKASAFDVVDYDHNYLPPPRVSLPARTLFVARSVLFIPFAPLLLADDYAGWRRRARAKLAAWRAARGRAPQPAPGLAAILPALRRADLLNVPNTRDAALAAALGHEPARVRILPYAVGRRQREALARVVPGRGPDFLFLGGFDSRKGGLALPEVFARLRAVFPDARLTVLGGGKDGGRSRVSACFPPEARTALTVTPWFPNETLPSLLAGRAVGVFPSRHEGFPFALLEQLHAGIPVAAYDAPGACDILPRAWLARAGDVAELADRAAALARASAAGEEASVLARHAAERFRIEELAARTRAVYAEARGLLA